MYSWLVWNVKGAYGKLPLFSDLLLSDTTDTFSKGLPRKPSTTHAFGQIILFEKAVPHCKAWCQGMVSYFQALCRTHECSTTTARATIAMAGSSVSISYAKSTRTASFASTRTTCHLPRRASPSTKPRATSILSSSRGCFGDAD